MQHERNICGAIARLVQINVRYSGKERVLEPYCHGTDTKGNEVLRAYQVSNDSGWRFFHVAKIERIEVTNEPFKPDRSDYNPRDKQMEIVHCCV